MDRISEYFKQPARWRILSSVLRSGFAVGSASTTRPLSLTHLNGRTVSYGDGVTSSIDSQISRITGLVDSDFAVIQHLYHAFTRGQPLVPLAQR